jgi:hypothetical protein
VATDQQKAEFQGHTLLVFATAFSGDGKTTFQGHIGPFSSVAFSPNGGRTMYADFDGTVCLREVPW